MARQAPFDLQGHRGARGLAPENTRAGFELALGIGVTTLETDMAATRDGVLVLSHDRHLDPALTRGPDGKWLAGQPPAIHTLTLAQLRAFDVGRIDPASAYARQFPLQKPVDGSRIPTLTELFALGEASGKAPWYNIETKISPLAPADTPDPETFAELVVETVRRTGVAARVTVQSFDFRTLLAVKRLAPEIATVGLTMDTPEESTLRGVGGAPSPWLAGIDASRAGAPAAEIVKAADCATWSPYWRDVDAASVVGAHALGLKVVPWTVNEAADMRAIVSLDVDGLITDYPDRARKVLAEMGVSIK